MRAERNREWPWRGRAVGREERSRKPYSVIVLGIGPGRQACHHIELPQQAAHQLVRIVFRAEILELIEHSGDGSIGVGNGSLRVVLALKREALAVFEEFFTIEVGQYYMCARNPIRAN